MATTPRPGDSSGNLPFDASETSSPGSAGIPSGGSDDISRRGSGGSSSPAPAGDPPSGASDAWSGGSGSSPDEFKRGLAAVWDTGAVSYDDLLGHGLFDETEGQAWHALLAGLLGDARRFRTPIRRVLDVGTGTGVLALLAADLGHDVIGLDLSSEMLRRASDKARDLRLSIRFFQGDAEDPPFGAGTFDAIVSRHLLWTLPDPPAAVTRWSELVVPGGLVAIVDGFQPAAGPIGRLLAALRAWRAGRISRPDGSSGTHEYAPEQFARLPLAHQRDQRAAERLLRRAGLCDVATQLLTDIDAAERAHRTRLKGAPTAYRHYLATGRRAP